jgi:RHH-type proline utilization regulon transcriptional repressor/proline dehydrogenase/delta 1-pyrroline-5-carboxylate dehydrogenase
VQEDVADKVIHMLKGAMAELKIGNPWDISVDVGPVIDVEAKSAIDAHCKKLEAEGRLIRKLSLPSQAKAGCFVSPAAYRINGIEELEKEIFGPVLHVATFKAEEVNEIVEKINATGYGLTLGLHTRVDTRVQDVCDRAHVGNLYVNRNQIGAVVGVQPFGGEGLSGTGPKAGGPLYLHRFVKKKGQAVEAPAQAAGKWTEASVSGELQTAFWELEKTQIRWDRREERRAILERASAKLDKSHQKIVRAALDQVEDYHPGPVDLVGPTGESNRLSLHGRGIILCAGSEAISMAVMALLTGNSVLLADYPSEGERLIKTFVGEKELNGLIHCLGDKLTPGLVAALPSVGGISLSLGEYDLRSYRQALAAREGAIIPLIVSGGEWEPYVAERALCIDTTASGGNTKLLAANEA